MGAADLRPWRNSRQGVGAKLKGEEEYAGGAAEVERTRQWYATSRIFGKRIGEINYKRE